MIRKLLLGAAGLVGILAVLGGAFYFSTPATAQELAGAEATVPFAREGRFGRMLDRIAEKLGLSSDELQAELDTGKTLEEIAAEQGVELPDKRGGKHGHGHGHGKARAAHVDKLAVLAEALGMSAEDVEAALKSGQKIDELAAEQGVELDAIKAAMAQAHTDAIAQAVADGTLTQEQADNVLARMELKQLAREVWGKDAKAAALADALGVGVDDVMNAGKKGIKELAGDDVDWAEVKASMEAARQAAFAAAVEDGTLTQEQADQLLEGCGKKGKGKDGFGRGHRGGGGFQGVTDDA